MLKFNIIYLTLIIIHVVFTKPTYAQEINFIEIIDIISGDTIKLLKPDGTLQTVRLISIKAPESPETNFGETSYVYLKNYLSENNVRIFQDKKDKNGRSLVWLCTKHRYLKASQIEKTDMNFCSLQANGKFLWNVNRHLVREGYVEAYKTKNDWIIQAMKFAQLEKIGIWRALNRGIIKPVTSQRICRMVESNLIGCLTGYSPCNKREECYYIND